MRPVGSLHLSCLGEAAHQRTCGYWYVITSAASPCTAFQHRDSLIRWASERGLTLPPGIPEPGVGGSFPIGGAYREKLHMNRAEFDALSGHETRAQSNGDWTLAIITADPDGLRTVHKLNPNVRDRLVFDHQESRMKFG